jgi:hypothetical protein
MATKPVLKKLPGFSQGVRVNSALRTVTLAQPICPFSRLEMEKDETGKWVPKQGPTDPERQNCQKGSGAWWKDCEARGHKPYEREVVWYVTEDVYDEETGELTGTKKFRRTRMMPNFKQVAISPHINSGQGARRAITNKGCKRLPEIGYEEVCQYRNCQNEIDPNACSEQFGNYCCKEELALVAAEQQGILLHRPDSALNGTEEPKVVRERQKQLMEAVAFATEKPNV